MKKIKVFHAGATHYSNFITNREIVKDIRDADLVVLEGGEDIDPSLYNEKAGSQTWCNPSRDRRDVLIFRQAVKYRIPILGICRGAQLACALSGGRLVQHMQHPGKHLVVTQDGETFLVNSLHHQMQYPYDMPKGKYEVLAHASGLSPMHLDGEDKQIAAQKTQGEAEVVYYPQTNALAIQCHPEMMFSDLEMNRKLFNWIYDQLKTKLNIHVII